ncbi:hypothetical protein PVAP13_2NG230415, partial [Panicum virgatum]
DRRSSVCPAVCPPCLKIFVRLEIPQATAAAGPSSQWPWPAPPLQNQARSELPTSPPLPSHYRPTPTPHLHISATRPPPRVLRRSRRDPGPRHSPEGTSVPARHSTLRPRIPRAAPTVQRSRPRSEGPTVCFPS